MQDYEESAWAMQQTHILSVRASLPPQVDLHTEGEGELPPGELGAMSQGLVSS